MNRPIADLFYENVERFPDKEAVYCDRTSYTYKELGNLVSRFSNFLLEKGVQTGDHIGIPMLNSITSVALILTANNIGVGLVPVNPSMPTQAINTIFESGDVKHLIAHKNFLNKKQEEISIPGLIFCIDEKLTGTLSLMDAQGCSTDRPECKQITGDETLVLIMTSGSTGDPKPIELTQNCKYLRAQIHFELYKLTEDDVILAGTPLFHSLALRLALLPLMLGGTSVILSRFTPQLWLECVEQKKVTFTIAVSSQLAQISELLEDESFPNIGSLRCLVSSSAWLEPNVKEKLIEKMSCEFHEIYGTSETASPTDIDFRDSTKKIKSVGKCVPGAKIRIRREDGREANVGEIGEITVETVQIFKGYYKRPELTEAAYDGTYFRTGDLGYVDEDGFLYFTGRIKDIIVSGGINIYPQDIESVVLDIGGVKECAAFSVKDKALGEIIGLAVVPDQKNVITTRQVAVYCAKNLADFQQPRKIYMMKELPKNAMGKIIKRELPRVLGITEEA